MPQMLASAMKMRYTGAAPAKLHAKHTTALTSSAVPHANLLPFRPPSQPKKMAPGTEIQAAMVENT